MVLISDPYVKCWHKEESQKEVRNNYKIIINQKLINVIPLNYKSTGVSKTFIVTLSFGGKYSCSGNK